MPYKGIPDWKPELLARLRGLRLTATREAEIVEELSQHLDDRYERLLHEGSSPNEARQAVILELAEDELLASELRRVEKMAPKHSVLAGAPLEGGRRNVGRDFLRFKIDAWIAASPCCCWQFLQASLCYWQPSEFME
jgi:hypothetical protein